MPSVPLTPWPTEYRVHDGSARVRAPCELSHPLASELGGASSSRSSTTGGATRGGAKAGGPTGAVPVGGATSSRWRDAVGLPHQGHPRLRAHTHLRLPIATTLAAATVAAFAAAVSPSQSPPQEQPPSPLLPSPLPACRHCHGGRRCRRRRHRCCRRRRLCRPRRCRLRCLYYSLPLRRQRPRQWHEVASAPQTHFGA
jgi:hypothetical protein